MCNWPTFAAISGREIELYNPIPGSFGLAVISGKTGKLVRWGQNIVEGRETHFTHAFLVLDNQQVIEAEPGGAQINSIDRYLDGDVLFSDAPIRNEVARAKALYDHPLVNDVYEERLRERVVDMGRGLKGIPYNYLDYLAIGLEHFHIRPKLVTNRVRRQDRLICSQLVDFIYNFAGIHLFNDGRLPQDVTPADLEQWIVDNG
jgi:hypothetical protein